MGHVTCQKHGGQIGSLTSNKIGEAIAGKVEVTAADIRSVYLSFSPDIGRDELKKRNVFDKDFLKKFDLAEEDDLLFVDDQNEKHVKLADDISLECGVCLREFLEKLGFKR